MQTWDIGQMTVVPHQPEILLSTDGARAIALALPAGEELQEHEVHEQAILVVLAGRVDVAAGGEGASGGPGFVAQFRAGERHEVRATEDARLLLLLAPWPGDGHPGAMTLGEKATARARAQARAAG